jgi:hypothetical protein
LRYAAEGTGTKVEDPTGGRVEKAGHLSREAPYPALTEFLRDQPPFEQRIALSLLMVEELLEEPLPVDAFLPSWWLNDPAVPHSWAWLAAGWEVEDMNPGRGVAFLRVRP